MQALYTITTELCAADISSTQAIQLLPFLNNVCEIKAITFTQNDAELLGIRKARRTCGSERPTDRPQRILVPGRGNAYGSLLFTHNDCRADLCSEWNAPQLSAISFRQEPLMNYAKRVKQQNNIVRRSHKINTY